MSAADKVKALLDADPDMGFNERRALLNTVFDHPVTAGAARGKVNRAAAEQDKSRDGAEVYATLEYDRLKGRKVAEQRLAEEEAAESAVDLHALILDRDQLGSLPAPDPLIPGVLERHAYALLTGRDGTYKTFIALDWALCLATGTPWMGSPVERVKVLYIAGEGAYGLADRVAAWEEARDVTVDPDYFRVLPKGVDLYGAADLPTLLDIAGGYGLIVLDTLRRVSGAADANSSQMGVVVDNIDALRRATHDGTVLAIAHTQKTDGDARGFSGIEDDADIVWHTKRDDLVTLSNRKMKNGPDGEEYVLVPRTVGESLVVEQAGTADLRDEANEAEQAILTALETSFLPEEGATKTELLEATGLSQRTYYRTRTALAAKGLVRVGDKGRDRGRTYRVETGSCHGVATAVATPAKELP